MNQSDPCSNPNNLNNPCLNDCHPECPKQTLPTWCRKVEVDQAPGAIVEVPRRGVAVAGHGGKARVGIDGIAVSGVCGYSGAISSSSHRIVAVVDNCGEAKTGDGGMAMAGHRGTASCNSRSYAFALKEGFASAGTYGVASTEGGFAQAHKLGIALAFGAGTKMSRAKVEAGGVAIGTPGNYLRAGTNGILIALPPETSKTTPPKVVQVGQENIEANMWYLIKEDLSFLKVSPELSLDLDCKWKPLPENASLDDLSTDQTSLMEPRSETGEQD